jgi:hypothetical protein
MEFMDLGDTAPNDRYNFRYTAKDIQVELSDALKTQLSDNTIALVNNKNIIFNSDKIEKIDILNTNAKVIAKDKRIFIPYNLLNERLGFTVNISENRQIILNKDSVKIIFEVDKKEITVGNKTVIIPAPAFIQDDVIYLPLNVIAYYAGLTVSSDENGVIFLSANNATVTDKTLFNEVRTIG